MMKRVSRGMRALLLVILCVAMVVPGLDGNVLEGYYKKTGYYRVRYKTGRILASRHYCHMRSKVTHMAGSSFSHEYYTQNYDPKKELRGLSRNNRLHWQVDKYQKKGTIIRCFVKSRQVDKKTYLKRLRRAIKGQKMVKIKYYSNTEANRKKILK